jgi:uncharacterized iron-regulated membrane protein
MSQRPNHGWIWFFAVIIVLAVAAAAITWTYNVQQQLTPEQLAAAQELWAKKGPADYDLRIEKKVSSAASDGEATPEIIEAKIRRGKVLAATLDGRPLEARLLPDYDMPSWFGFVEEFLRQDTAPNARRTFRTAFFDPQTGALLNFRRRVSGTHERQEVTIQVSPPSPLKPTNPS